MIITADTTESIFTI